MWAMWPLGLLYINTESRYGSLNCTGSFEETHLVLILKYQHLWRTDPVHILENSLIYSTWALSFFPLFFFFYWNILIKEVCIDLGHHALCAWLILWNCFYSRGSLFLDISKIFLVLHVLVLHVLVLLVLSKFEIILFNSCPHRQWWFRKYAMFFKVFRVLQLSVYLWFYIKFNLNIFFLLKKSFAAGIHYSNVWVIVNCPPQMVT